LDFGASPPLLFFFFIPAAWRKNPRVNLELIEVKQRKELAKLLADP
jgi:hypothetical protein